MAESVLKRQKVIERFQLTALLDAAKKLRKACKQIKLLNCHMEATQMRYHKAKEENFRSFRYNLRLRLAVIEGTRNMYYDYAQLQADIVAELRRLLYGQEVDIVTSDDSDSEGEEEFIIT